MNIKTLSLNVLLLWSGIFLSVSATAILAPGCDAPYEAGDGYRRMIRTLDKRSSQYDPSSDVVALLQLS
jgi:hypothetical protein